MKRYEAYKDSGILWVGEIPEGWKIVPLKHYLSLKGRIGWNGLKSDEFKEKSYAYLVTGQDFNSAVVNWDKCYQIDKNRYDEDPFIQLSNGDLLVTKDGTIGKIAKVANLDKPACLNSGIFVVKQKEGIFTQDYLYWLLVSNQLKEFVGYNSTGSTIAHLYQNVFENMPLTVPPIKEQKTIAAYLDYKVGQIDKSISEIDSQIDSLKAYRQSVISEAVTKGLDKNARMKDSGIEWIGEIPEGWNVIPMKHYFYMKGRIGWQGLKADEFLEEGPFLVTGTDFKNGRVNWNTCYHITEARYQEAPEIHVHEGDVLITKDGTIGKLAYIEDKPEKVSLNSHLLILRPTKDVVNNYFVFWSLQSSAFKDYSGLASSGSTMASLSQEKIGSYFMALPPVDEQYIIAKYLENKMARIDKAINALDAQRTDFNVLKQAVISEAVTGKIDVRDWTPSVEQ